MAFTSTASTGSNAGAILDMNQVQNISGSVTLPAAGVNPVLINVVNISNGLNTRIAVSPRLNWALATPGGAGALSIVDLGRQTVNQISGIGCISGSSPPTVTVTATTVNSLQVGQPVLISGVSPASFNGIFAVTAVNNTSFQYFAHAPCPSGAPSGSGGTASYATPVASVGVDLNVRSVSINDETEKALLVDPTSAEPAFIFNILDQSSTPVNNLPASTSNIAGAINPLTNGALVLNKGGQAYVIDPTVPTVTCSSQPCPSPNPSDVYHRNHAGRRCHRSHNRHRRYRESRRYGKPLFPWRLALGAADHSNQRRIARGRFANLLPGHAQFQPGISRNCRLTRPSL